MGSGNLMHGGYVFYGNYVCHSSYHRVRIPVVYRPLRHLGCSSLHHILYQISHQYTPLLALYSAYP